MVILGTRTCDRRSCVCRLGLARSIHRVDPALLAISVWIRLSMNESPAFQKMKAEGKTSKAPLSESFGQWKNLKIVISGADRFDRWSGRGLVLGPVLRPVLPDASS
jgi:hypothetical protein